MNISQQAKLLELIEAFANARVEASWAGGGDPADVPLLEADLREAHIELTSYIQELTE